MTPEDDTSEREAFEVWWQRDAKHLGIRFRAVAISAWQAGATRARARAALEALREMSLAATPPDDARPVTLPPLPMPDATVYGPNRTVRGHAILTDKVRDYAAAAVLADRSQR